jgi:hypothetical protein
MKNLFFAIFCFCSFGIFAQTAGALTLTFTQTPHTSFQGTRNVMAVWIQSSTGSFVKTRARNVGNGTKDHLPTWAVNSGGTAGNATSANCNVVGAISGATLTNFSTRTFTWDGTDASGNLVADGTYKITIESTWNHGANGGTVTTYTFVKGPNPDVQAPANDANFTNIALAWNPSGASVNTIEPIVFTIQPNPSVDGKVSFNGLKANDEVVVYDLNGAIVFSGVSTLDEIFTIDLHVDNGTYLVKVTRDFISKEERIVINK